MNIPYNSIHTGADIDDAVTKAFAAQAVTSRMYSGTLDLGSGVTEGSITGLTLPFTPARAFLQVDMPIDGYLLFALPKRDTVTTDGFSFYLSAATDSINYRLHYLLIGDVETSSSGTSS